MFVKKSIENAIILKSVTRNFIIKKSPIINTIDYTMKALLKQGQISFFAVFIRKLISMFNIVLKSENASFKLAIFTLLL